MNDKAPIYVSDAVEDVVTEILRQEELKREGRFKYTPKDMLMYTETLALLTEEVGEVSREILGIRGLVQEKGDIRNLRKELIQVAAIAVAWVEGIDERTL